MWKYKIAGGSGLQYRLQNGGAYPFLDSERKGRIMWYAIQTMTGREEETIETIRKVIEPRICMDCFLLKREAIWRIHGGCRIHTERLFPGYVFVRISDPEEFYRQLKQVPQFTRILGKDGLDFQPVSQEEEKFLKQLLNKDQEYTVRLSPVEVDKQGNIISCGEPLKRYINNVVKKRIRLRYVIIRVWLLGRERDILLGIRVEGDSCTDYETGKEEMDEAGNKTV